MDTEIITNDLKALLDVSHGILNATIFHIAGTPISLMTLLIFMIIVALTFRASALLQRGLVKGLRSRGMTDLGTMGLVRRLTHYAVMAVGFGVALQTMGIDLGALFAAGAVFAVGIGFAMQNIAQNFVSGLILLVERSIRPNDILMIGDNVVKVEELGIRATVVRTRDGEAMIVPNSNLVADAVRNFTLGAGLFRVTAQVGVTYSSDMKLVRETIEATVAGLSFSSPKRPPAVQMTSFGDNSVNFAVRVWIDDPWEQRNLLSDLYEALWWSLQEADVVIAFPQLDVHFDPPVTEGFSRIKAAS